MTFEQETDLLCVYLYDLISENEVADGHLLSSRDSDRLQICAERLSAQANLIEDQAKRIVRLEAEIKNLKALLRAVFEELDEGDGNAPGDSHEKPGIWDDDNTPDIAGKPCHWCELWAMVKDVSQRP